MRAVSRMELLESRELRHERQRCLVEGYQMPLVTFTLNIPGEIKDSHESRVFFRVGGQAFEDAIQKNAMKILHRELVRKATGAEGYYIIDATATEVKRIAVELEENHALGRMFDFDVLSRQYVPITRASIGMHQRTCIICHDNATVCRRMKRHSIIEVKEAFSNLLTEFLVEEQTSST